MRRKARVLVGILVATLGLCGCETTRENPKTAIGAGAGVAGGALIGGLIGRNTTGVVIGGLLGGLAGGGIGYYLDRNDKPHVQAAAEAGYTPAQGIVVRVDSVQTEPAVVQPGQTVYLGTTYTVLTPNPNQAVTVNETREIRHNGTLVTSPTTRFSRNPGTFTGALPITLPTGAGRGPYEGTITVATSDRISRGASTFVVQ